MTIALPPYAARLARDLSLPVTAALLVLGTARLLLSVKASCDVLQCDDFGRFWYATSAWWLNGTSLYAITPASIAVDGTLCTNLNLPATHVLFVPFTWVALDTAAVVWLLIGFGCVAASMAVIRMESGWTPSWAWLAVFVWWMPTHVQAVTGQVAWVLLPVVTMAWAAGRHKRWDAAGAWLGIALAMKPFLLPLVGWLLWRRAYRAICWCALASGVVLALGGLIFGTVAYHDWKTSVSSVTWFGNPANASLWGWILRSTTEGPTFAPLTVLGPMARWLAIALSVIVLTVSLAFERRIIDFDDQWTLAMAATLLVCPLGWVYYGCLLLPGWRGRWPGPLATACWLIPTPWLVLGQPSPAATVLWGSAAAWGLFLVWLKALRPA